MIVVAATKNQNKIKEIKAIIEPYGFQIVSGEDANLAEQEIEEDGLTLEENSLKKAMVIHRFSGKVTIADDSGLFVDALDGAPGVHSARFSGEAGNDIKNNMKLLALMSALPKEKRTGKFVSVITMVFSTDDIIVAKGECPGHILFEAKGDGGFGYDPLFVPEGYDLSFGQLSAETKNRISHRAIALNKLKEQLKTRLSLE